LERQYGERLKGVVLYGSLARGNADAESDVRDLVNAGTWTQKLGKDYDLLMDLRETGDYGGLTRVLPEDAQLASEAAQRIISAVRETCPELAAD